MATVEKKKKNSLKDFFKGVRLELKKVVWPTRKELVSYTVVVLVICLVFALGFWIVDTGVLAALRAIIGA
ncbi:MAG: preprotein translocase subunit SecE [Clostridia bacterium]|nr:preprotein translocase subunit SecE [Clostridia bacterium]